MLIKMLQTRRGTEDGFSIQQFFKDQEYDVRDNLACAFIAAGYAQPGRKPFSNTKKQGKLI
jgi:hypothetical protein